MYILNYSRNHNYVEYGFKLVLHIQKNVKNVADSIINIAQRIKFKYSPSFGDINNPNKETINTIDPTIAKK